jgi:hypothetical protein
MSEQTSAVRPTVRVPVALGILLGLLQLIPGIRIILRIGTPTGSPDMAGFVLVASCILLGSGALTLLSAYLMGRYRRLGLLLGLLIHGGAFLLFLSDIGRVSFGITQLATVAATLMLLYYIYKYLTRAAERQFFR